MLSEMASSERYAGVDGDAGNARERREVKWERMNE
jgi:hypothetical protein